ncbi:hypothetical protein J2X47_004182 [Sphingomonas sp. BE270]|jgi:hypothetical protein|uniref:SRPBCC family protein n=2 Tax=Pseudomonadota TaxID=1224 RepID=A0ABU4PGS8_9SPHN|nr:MULTISPECIES: SRPBCC family protein [Sphingomonas]MDR6848923.1 hypothetical protein [Sphingomonas sp. BE137]MDR7259974.1 hypothetical protein [Sphingomonas sp. BE270]MDX5983164.1 SRPBCC family protein [Sphingomonas echinoides]RUN75324.1 hypothetical protein EJC47_16900 [Sphingomonas sp. TF3]
MKEETSFDFNMSALRVWSLISDLRSFARWHPVYRIAGEAERGAEIDVTWLLFGGDRKMTTQMIINRLTKPQLIGWQMGVRGFLTLDERYEIEPIANGVCVHHSVECRGIVGALVGRMMRKGLRRTMRQQDAAFLALLRRQSRLPGRSTRNRPRPIKPPAARNAAND